MSDKENKIRAIANISFLLLQSKKQEIADFFAKHFPTRFVRSDRNQ